MLGKIEDHVAKPLTHEEIEHHIMREVVLRAEVESLTSQRDALAKVADRLLTALENVVEGLGPEGAQQVAEMRATIDASTA